MAVNGDIKNLLITAKENNCKVYAWYLFHQSFMKVELSLVSYRNDRKQIIFHVDVDSKYYLDQMISGNGHLNICIPDLSINFKSELQKYDSDGTVILKYPNIVSQWERRSGDRIDASGITKIDFTLGTMTVSKTGYDISRGGLSIVLSKREALQFEKVGDKSIVGKIKFNNKLFDVELAVVGQQKITPYRLERVPFGALKISFKFINIPDSFLKSLDDFIIEYQKLDHNVS